MDINIYKKNIADLQQQLHDAQIRIKELREEIDNTRHPIHKVRKNALNIDVDENTYRINSRKT